MGKAFGVLLIVGLLWIGLELYVEGPSRAFGGAVAFLAPSGGSDEEQVSTPQRVGSAVSRAHQLNDERRERQLEE